MIGKLLTAFGVLAVAGFGFVALKRRRDAQHELYAPAAVPPGAKKMATAHAITVKATSGKTATRVDPKDRGAPPLDASGHLGHTGIAGSNFWGLPMKTIWMVEDAYASGKTSRMAGAASAVRGHGFRLLAEMIESDVKKRGLD